MTHLLDTNAVSEFVKPRPDDGFVEWLATADENGLFLSTVTIAELRLGVELIASDQRRRLLSGWLAQDLLKRFYGRILAVDIAVAEEWARMIAARRRAGRPMQTMDALIAATANVHRLTLVTRNPRDFRGSVTALLNPWSK